MDDKDKFIDEYIINIFYLISEYEASVSIARQDLNNLKETDSAALFKYVSRDNKVTANEFLSYLV